MKKVILTVVGVVYIMSLTGCAEYKVSDIKKSIMTMNANGQKEVKSQKEDN